MIRYQIFENDVTTAGGIVQRHTGGGKSFIWHNRLASNIGDKIKCPKCGSVGYIKAAGLRRSFDNHKDIPALNGDLCICKCNPPPVLKHSQTSFIHNVAGGIIINNFKNPLTSNIPNSQQNLNNSLVDDKPYIDRSYYKWEWGGLQSTKPETVAQMNRSFLQNFSAFHDEYAFSKNPIIYEIDPKAWETEAAFEQLLSIIQESADEPTFTISKNLQEMNLLDTRHITIDDIGVGGNYARIARSKHWPHGRIRVILHGNLTKYEPHVDGSFNFRFEAVAMIKDDTYSWVEDADGARNLAIKYMGNAVRYATGSKQPAKVYNPNPSKTIGLPVTYKRDYYFDYYKFGDPPKYKK